MQNLLYEDNSHVNSMRGKSDDDFYTKPEYVANELDNGGYEPYFRGKRVYVPCIVSKNDAFWRCLTERFSSWGMRDLIGLVYQDGRVIRFKNGRTVTAGYVDSGDYLGPDSEEIMEQCDIVVTNPPYSNNGTGALIQKCVEMGKGFLVLGSHLSWQHPSIKNLLLNGDIWLGVTRSKRMMFGRPDGMPDKGMSSHFYTNIGEPRYPEFANKLKRNYEEDEYDFDQSGDYLMVDRVEDIPSNYYGPMRVPQSFISSYNPDEFEILGDAGKITRSDGTDVFMPLAIRRKR